MSALGIAATGLGVAGAIGDILGLGQTDVTLGGFVFSGATMAVPSEMRWGTNQHIAKHVLQGGLVRMDAMGVDWPPISWKGIFDGLGATDKAKALAMLTAAGAVLTLTWMDRIFLVVIKTFQATDKMAGWVEYSITCEVMADADQMGGPPGIPSLLEQVTDDINAAIELVSVIGAIVVAVQTAMAFAAAFSPGTSANASLIAQLQAFEAEQQAEQDDADAGIIGLGTGTGGPSGAINWMTSGMAMAAQQAAAAASIGPIGRSIANLMQASA